MYNQKNLSQKEIKKNMEPHYSFGTSCQKLAYTDEASSVHHIPSPLGKLGVGHPWSNQRLYRFRKKNIMKKNGRFSTIGSYNRRRPRRGK